jgi:hypothetical protein
LRCGRVRRNIHDLQCTPQRIKLGATRLTGKRNRFQEKRASARAK